MEIGDIYIIPLVQYLLYESECDVVRYFLARENIASAKEVSPISHSDESNK